jgi:SAM-dependent methyltransferase
MSILGARVLDKAKLDVIDKVRSNLFNWRGQFTPQFIEYLLDTYATPTDLVFDPFCGSGTVLLECAQKGLNSTGSEINPAAYAMAKFITLSSIPPSERQEIFQSVEARVEKLTGRYGEVPLFEPKPLFRDQYKNLLEFAEDLFKRIENKNEMLMAVVTLFHAEKNGKADLVSAIKSACAVVKNKLQGLPYTNARVSMDLRDARLSHQRLFGQVNIIITSPPYINVFNYHQNYRAILEVLGFDLLKVAESEIGSNRKNRVNRFRTVVQYSLDMEQALKSFALSLKKNGVLILVVGRESRVRGIPFSNSGILKDLAIGLRCFRKESENERMFTNRFGQQIKEDILVFRRIKDNPSGGIARGVAEDYLKRSVEISAGDVQDDITDVVSYLTEIEPSPMFNKKEII